MPCYTLHDIHQSLKVVNNLHSFVLSKIPINMENLIVYSVVSQTSPFNL